MNQFSHLILSEMSQKRKFAEKFNLNLVLFYFYFLEDSLEIGFVKSCELAVTDTVNGGLTLDILK